MAPPPREPLSPGRIGNVIFFPNNSYRRLEGKPAGWNKDTLSGRFPSASEYIHELEILLLYLPYRYSNHKTQGVHR